jgi:hypothetical protein
VNRRERERRAREKRYERLRQRILRNIVVDEKSGCWIWQGRKNKGHGVMTVRLPGDYRTPRPLYVHRVAWEAFKERKMPAGRVGAHSYKCIAASCCNPDHVRATTQSHNIRDQRRAKKWREKTIRGPALFPPIHSIRGGK